MRWFVHITSFHRLLPPQLAVPTPAPTLTLCGFASAQSSQFVAEFAAAEARLLGGTLASLIPIESLSSLVTGDLLVIRAPQSLPVATGRFVRARLIEVANKNSIGGNEQLTVRLLDFSCPVNGQPLEVSVGIEYCRKFFLPDRNAESDAKDIEVFANWPPMGRCFRLIGTDIVDINDFQSLESLTGSLVIVTASPNSEPDLANTDLPSVRLHQLNMSDLESPRHRHSGSQHWVGNHWSKEPLHSAESDALAGLEIGQLREYIIHCNCLAGRELALHLFEEKVRNDCNGRVTAPI